MNFIKNIFRSEPYNFAGYKDPKSAYNFAKDVLGQISVFVRNGLANIWLSRIILLLMFRGQT